MRWGVRIGAQDNATNAILYDVNDGGDITEYYYDRLGRVTDVNDPADRLVSYEYDDRGLRTKLTYPDESYITYVYDAGSRLRRILDDSNDVLAEYTYDGLSRRTLLTLGNDANAVYEYDLASRLRLLTNNIDDTNSIVFDYNDYDAVGNRLSLQIDDANEQTFTYDNLYQLITVDYNDGNMVDYYYDPVGNRTSVVDTATTNYTANSLNQYTAVGAATHTYDDNGNLAYDGAYRYYYDDENRLTDVNDAADDPIASYRYDYRGRRIRRTVYGTPNVVTKYAYDGDRVVAEYDGSGTLLRKFIYGPGIDEPICLIDAADANETYYYHFDGLGSVVALSDVNNVLVERYRYDVFGRPTIRDVNGTEISASALNNPYLFTGRRYDAEAGLYYYRARYYDFATGRFLQPDPLGYADGLNMYAYVGNNPLSWIDPLGLSGMDSLFLADMVEERFRPPNEFEQGQIDKIISDFEGTGDPVLERIADSLSQREYVIDEWLPKPRAGKKATWGYVKKYWRPNTIHLNPATFTFGITPGIRNGRTFNAWLLENMIHENWHLTSAPRPTRSFLDPFLGRFGDDGVHRYYETYSNQIADRYWRIVDPVGRKPVQLRLSKKGSQG